MFAGVVLDGQAGTRHPCSRIVIRRSSSWKDKGSFKLVVARRVERSRKLSLFSLSVIASSSMLCASALKENNSAILVSGKKFAIYYFVFFLNQLSK